MNTDNILRCGRQRNTTILYTPSKQLQPLIFKMDSFRVKILSKRILSPQSDVRVAPIMQNTDSSDKIHKIGTCNVRPMHQGGKLENIKMEMKKLDIDN